MTSCWLLCMLSAACLLMCVDNGDISGVVVLCGCKTHETYHSLIVVRLVFQLNSHHHAMIKENQRQLTAFSHLIFLEIMYTNQNYTKYVHKKGGGSASTGSLAFCLPTDNRDIHLAIKKPSSKCSESKMELIRDCIQPFFSG